jgi:hypothetical protein
VSYFPLLVGPIESYAFTASSQGKDRLTMRKPSKVLINLYGIGKKSGHR